MGDGQSRGDKRVRGHDHLVARTNSVRLQDEGERRGTGRHTDAVLDLTIGGELLLEAFDFLAKSERA